MGVNDLQLEIPLVFFDLETTGLNVAEARIVELFAIKLAPDMQQSEIHYLVDPEIPIPPRASEIHGIRDEDVAGKPKFREIADELLAFVENCDFAGFNIRKFDLPLLAAEFKRNGIKFEISDKKIIDMQAIFHIKEPRDLTAALTYYCGESHEAAHSARADVEACIKIFDSQLDRYEDLPRTAVDLHDLCNPGQKNWVDPDGKFILIQGEPVINFGKYKDKMVSQVAKSDPGYLQWIAGSDFSEVVKELVRSHLKS